MAKIKVNIVNRQKTFAIPSGMRLLIRRSCHAVLQMEGFEGDAEVDVSIVDNDQIRVINNEQRRIDAVTDVLSFPLGENGVYDKNPATGAYMLGDIVLSAERAASQAEQFGHDFRREVGYLTTHSMLHLLGYDHENEGIEAVRMREKEEQVLNKLGLKRDGSYVMEEE